MAAGHASEDSLSIVLKDAWRWNTKHLDYTEYSLFSHCFDRKIIKRCKWFGLSWIYEVRYLLLINNYLEKNGQIHSVKSILICDSAEVTAQKKRRWKKAREKSRELSLAPDWITFSCLVILKHRNHSKHTFLFSSHSLSLCEQFLCSLCHNQQNLVKPTGLSTNPLFCLEYVKTERKIINRRAIEEAGTQGGIRRERLLFSRARAPRFLTRMRTARALEEKTRREN